MDSLPYNFSMEDQKSIFTTDSKATTAKDSFSAMENRTIKVLQESVFSPMAPPFQSRGGNDLLSLMSEQEPRAGDTAPPASDLDDGMVNFRVNGSDMIFDDLDQNTPSYYVGGGSRPDSALSSNIWGDNSSVSGNKNAEMTDTFDFLIKCLSSANNFVSTLTREQLSVLRSIRPSLLYDFLLEVAKVRSQKRICRALPNECAFCKNNGENEECYSSHVLKDWRGRVLCPVLRAFHCPRCGATGDRAHTIKYCPENDADRSGLSSRRRMSNTSLLLGHTRAPLGTPASSPAPSTAGLPQSSFWSSSQMAGHFNIN